MEKGPPLSLLSIHLSMNLTFLRYAKLKEYFHSDWHAALHGSLSQWQQAGVDKQGIERFFANKKTVSVEKKWDDLERCGAQVLIYGEKKYPISLMTIASAPVVLFCRGQLEPSDFPSLSVVGSRGISSYGVRAIETLVGEIARAGITIVSGLAMGADTVAHKTAVKHGGRTICVLGNGIDFVYPSQNQKFADQLLREKKGVILSEYFPGEEARPEYFPVRNRIVAGLSKATIVIEAAEKSGSLITAQMALDEGRDVFAVPGEIFARNSKGTNELLWKSGAAPALSGQQILEALGFRKFYSPQKTKREIALSPAEIQVLELFGTEHRLHINDLIQKSKSSSAEVSACVSLLEIKGVLKNMGNQTFSKN